MPMTLVKRIFVYFMVIAFIGTPWVQAFSQSPTRGCHTSIMVPSGGMDLHKAVPGNVAVHKTDHSKIMPVNCQINCLAQSNFIVPAFSLSFENWPQFYEPAVKVPLDGRTLKPELSPPIKLI